MAFLRFDSNLKLTHHTIPPLSDDIYNYFKTIMETKSKAMNVKLISILKLRPDSEVVFFKIYRSTIATWTKKQSPITIDKWRKYVHLRHYPDHETSSAIIAAHMISILRHLVRIDTVFTDYSAQYLLDFAHPTIEKQAKRRRMCSQTLSVVDGLRYALEHDIPKEESWEYVGYGDSGKKIVDLVCYPVEGEIVEPQTLKTALTCLKFTPVAAKLHVFEPDLTLAKDEIYRGPRNEASEYNGLQNVMIYGTKVMNEELVAFVKFPCYKVKYVNVSLDMMMVQAPEENDKYLDQLEELTCLLTDFCVLLPPK